MKSWIAVGLLFIVAVSSASASAATAAAVDGKASQNEAVELKTGSRQDKSFKYPEETYNQFAPAAPQQYSNQVYPAPAATVSDPNTNAIGLVYYYLPTVEKYYPQIKDFIPFIKKYDPYIQRALPTIRRAAERTFDVGAALGTAVLFPVLIVAAVAFLGFGLFSLVPVLVGKRRTGRDVSDDLDVQPRDRSARLLDLVSRVDRAIDAYTSALRDERCLEKYSCEAGQFTKRMSSFITNPLIKILEPFIPKYMMNKFEAFKFGARSGNLGCEAFTCKNFFSFLG